MNTLRLVMPLFVLGFFTSFSIQAATFTVDRKDDPFPSGVCDDGIVMDCSLREAIITANASPLPDLIILPAGTYLLTRIGIAEDASFTGDLDISNAVSIQGAGIETTIIDGGGAGVLGDRVLNLFNASGTEIRDLTIQGGYVGVSEGGGGIANHSHLTIDMVRLRNNESRLGGGLFNSAGSTVGITNSEFSTNHARLSGGGVFNEGTAFIDDSDISDNTSDLNSAGLLNSNIMTLNRVTVHGNTAQRSGGIDNNGDSFIMRDSVVSGNRAEPEAGATWGGAGMIQFAGNATIERTVFSDNHAVGLPGGAFWVNADMTLDQVTIDGNSSTEDGGAIELTGGILSMNNSTVSNNESQSGAIFYIAAGELNILNSTISGNTSRQPTIDVVDKGMLSARHLTFYDNDSPLLPEIRSSISADTVPNIIFGNSLISGSCSGNQFETEGGNIIGPTFGCGIKGTPGDMDLVADFLLGKLSDNGGLTLTHLPLEGSPVIDFADPNICTKATGDDGDQRGLPRFVDINGKGDLCDTGAVEVQPVILPEFMFGDGFEDL